MRALNAGHRGASGRGRPAGGYMLQFLSLEGRPGSPEQDRLGTKKSMGGAGLGLTRHGWGRQGKKGAVRTGEQPGAQGPACAPCGSAPFYLDIAKSKIFFKK